MSYKIEFLHRGHVVWQTAMSGLPNEAAATFHAQQIAKRPNYQRVRIVDSRGSVVWIS